MLHIRGERAASPRELFTFGMVRHGPRGIAHILNQPGDSEVVDDVGSYGIDWAAINDPVLMAHHHAHNSIPRSQNPFATAESPEHLSEVLCEPPTCPLSPLQLRSLNGYLAQACALGARDMLVRRHTWVTALQYCYRLCYNN